MTPTRRWLPVSHAAAPVLAVTLGYFLLRIPIQVSDCFTNMLVLDKPFLVLMRDVSLTPGYLRPGLWAELKVVYDLSQGAYFTWFRWTQVVQAALVIALFVNLARPRDVSGAAALPLALTVLVGHHTFAWTVREAFPINTFLTIVVCCAAAANLAFARHRWWTDVAAVVLFVVAAATVESGLLVGGIIIVGYALGLRGVSGRGVAAVLALIAGYFILRFLVFDIGTPTLLDRDAGYGFARHNAAEIARMFAGRAAVFYAYNVVSSVVGTLAAEPRDGAWLLTRSLVEGAPDVPLSIGFVSSMLATGLIARYAWVRRTAWARRDLDHGDRLVVLFVLVLAGNAAISYAYTKDVIMSPAGFFFAAAFFVACRHFIDGLGAGASRAAVTGGAALLLVLSSSWAVRAVGLHAGLAQTAHSVREHWAYVDETIERMGYVPVPPSVAALKQTLQADAVERHPDKPELQDRWMALFEMD